MIVSDKVQTFGAYFFILAEFLEDTTILHKSIVEPNASPYSLM